ncbi:transferase [Rivibacter subsaxonicus]|uniref:Spermidine synthase n=1 Tax=Rivibacter subsaxonicus TaxID=457575 RepID=A0A4Q7VNG3_9BURK|nr:transferase [Rivibacter subsaxonicus]RZT97678.1 spermidine synthase [Rivibacter subsaxonicus]
MPDHADSPAFERPFVYEALATKALYFSISEIQSRMLILEPDVLDLEYTRVMMGFLMFEPQPRRIGMIGLGGGSLAKFCYRHLPQAHIEVVEINPHVIELRDEFQVPPDDQRFTVACGCGAAFVQSPSAPFDVLLVDGYDRDGQSTPLASQRFYDDCRAALGARGVMVANLHAGHPEHAQQLERIRLSFGGSVVTVGDDDCGNSLVFGLKGHPIDGHTLGPLARPTGLDRQAWAQLMPSFSRLAAALRNERLPPRVPDLG